MTTAAATSTRIHHPLPPSAPLCTSAASACLHRAVRPSTCKHPHSPQPLPAVGPSTVGGTRMKDCTPASMYTNTSNIKHHCHPPPACSLSRYCGRDPGGTAPVSCISLSASLPRPPLVNDPLLAVCQSTVGGTQPIPASACQRV
jgi:hypothetical protein